MMSNKDSNDRPVIDTERLRETLSPYKFPLILSIAGIILLTFAIVLLIKSQFTSGEVVFTTEASPSSQTKIRIDIEGAVLSPGVYEFTEGSRIADALVAAGGLSADADRSWVSRFLNRAAKLVDGGKIYIPKAGEATSAKPQSNLGNLGNLGPTTSEASSLLGVSEGKVNLNTASQAELEALSGIGPVTAVKIISGRPYQSVEELRNRKILGQKLFDKLKDLLTVY